MKNVSKIICVIGSLFLIMGCQNQDDLAPQEPETIGEELEQDQQADEIEEDESKENHTSEEEKGNQDQANENQEESTSSEEIERVGYVLLRPELGSTRQFKQDGIAILTEEVVAENKEFVQLTVTLGDSKTTEVYRWTPEEITLIYQDYYENGDEKGILDKVSDSDYIERYVGEDADWEVLGENVSETIDGEEMNVLKVYNETEEIVGHVTKKTRYFADQFGLVFEKIEVVGEQGYVSETIIELP